MLGSHQTNVHALEGMFPGIICHHCWLADQRIIRSSRLEFGFWQGPSFMLLVSALSARMLRLDNSR